MDIDFSRSVAAFSKRDFSNRIPSLIFPSKANIRENDESRFNKGPKPSPSTMGVHQVAPNVLPIPWIATTLETAVSVHSFELVIALYSMDLLYDRMNRRIWWFMNDPKAAALIAIFAHLQNLEFRKILKICEMISAFPFLLWYLKYLKTNLNDKS